MAQALYCLNEMCYTVQAVIPQLLWVPVQILAAELWSSIWYHQGILLIFNGGMNVRLVGLSEDGDP